MKKKVESFEDLDVYRLTENLAEFRPEFFGISVSKIRRQHRCQHCSRVR